MKNNILREHLCDRDIVTLNKEPNHIQNRFKPVGLWYQCNGDWERWYQSEMPHWANRFAFKHNVAIDSKANIIVLDTVEKMHSFNKKYLLKKKLNYSFDKTIDWKQVAIDYDGIEIPYYQWSLRMHEDFNWYYSWDCASGCIWNTKHLTLKPSVGDNAPVEL